MDVDVRVKSEQINISIKLIIYRDLFSVRKSEGVVLDIVHNSPQDFLMCFAALTPGKVILPGNEHAGPATSHNEPWPVRSVSTLVLVCTLVEKGIIMLIAKGYYVPSNNCLAPQHLELISAITGTRTRTSQLQSQCFCPVGHLLSLISPFAPISNYKRVVEAHDSVHVYRFLYLHREYCVTSS